MALGTGEVQGKGHRLTEALATTDGVSEDRSGTGAQQVEAAQSNVDSELGLHSRDTSGSQHITEVVGHDVVSADLAEH